MDYITGQLNHPCHRLSLFLQTSHQKISIQTQLLVLDMDDAWVQHVASILEYLDGRAQSPNTQTCQSARDLMASLDAWSFMGSTSHYGLQVRALSILQRVAYHDADRGAIADMDSWVLERWLRVLQRYPRSVQGLQGMLKECYIVICAHIDV